MLCVFVSYIDCAFRPLLLLFRSVSALIDLALGGAGCGAVLCVCVCVCVRASPVCRARALQAISILFKKKSFIQ